MFKLIKHFNENGINLKAGKYSREQLAKLYGGEDRFNFCFTCTSLKNALIEIKQKTDKGKTNIDETISEISDVKKDEEFPPIIISYIAKEDIKKDKKVIFNKDQKITLEELETYFTLQEVADKLIETKGV